MSKLPEIDSPEAARELREYLKGLDAGSYGRGREYFRTGRVLHIRAADDQAISATVRGTDRYAVELIRDGHRWGANCSCPTGGGCKHVVAAALKWMQMCGVAATGERAASREEPPLAVVSPFRTQWQPVLEKKLGRTLTVVEELTLARLAQMFHNFQQSGTILVGDLQQMGLPPPVSAGWTSAVAHETWWEVPPADAWEFWQFIACDLELRGETVPEFLRPLTDTTAARTSRLAGERRALVEKWQDRFESLERRAPPVSAPAASPLLELRVMVDGRGWGLETRATPAAPWKSVGKNFLDRYLREDATLTSSLDVSPELYAFLALCRERIGSFRIVGFGGTNREHLELLHALVSNRLARALVVDREGRPFVMSEAPVSWRMTRPEQGQGDYRLELVRPDGDPLPEAVLHLPGRPDLYLHAGLIYSGPPGLVEGQASATLVPREVIEEPAVLLTLKKFGTRMPAEIERRFLNVALRTRIECTLLTDFTERELLALRLTAVADKPPVFREWVAQGWKEEDEPAGEGRKSGKAANLLHLVDCTVADRVAGGLAGLGVTFDSYQARWVRRVTRSFPEEFLAWRAALPPEVEVVAEGELASLLADPVRARIEFELLETTAHRDWFDLALALKPEDTSLTAAEISLLLKARGKLVRLEGKGWRRLEVEIEGAPLAALESAGFDPDGIAEAAANGEKHRFHALQLSQQTMTDALPEKQAEALRVRARELTAPKLTPLPAGLRAELRPYQVEGFRFLTFLAENRLGGVLADDMGLGKTLQALAWLLWLAERQPKDEPLRVLVVCPKSVVGNWEAETAKFAPALKVVRFTGAATTRGKVLTGPKPLIVVANYVQLRLRPEFFQGQKWHAVVLDEGQFIKTPSSKVAQIARDLPGENRLVLTGTPIENRLLDLWSLFAFALPGLLGSQASFKRQYTDDNPLSLARLRDRVRHFLLRRTKGQVASDLPPRTEEDVVVELEGVQAQLYQAELKRARAALLKVGTPKELGQARFHILASLMKLRQICCHPALVDPVHRNEPSAKLEELLERLTELQDEGHQVLVFSQFVEMLEIIRTRLDEAKIGHLMLTGQTENRDELVAQFQSDRSKTVFLLSLKAAGFGLNLTAASYVILYDPWWNPAVEAQAIDRTHRIGQVSPVNAYRLIAEGTVEEKIRGLQKEKATLAGAIVQEESLAKVLDLETLRQVLA